MKSKAAEVSYKLDEAPEDMTVAAVGQVRSGVLPGQAGKTVPVIVTVSNASGKEVFHSFEIIVD